MKLICFSILLIIFSNLSLADSYRTTVLVYDYKNRLLPRKVVLKYLENSKSFDGKYFKIVKGKSDEAISFDDEIALRAAHVYYHLHQARQYFLNVPQANKDHLNKKHVIRLDLTNKFDPFAKFTHDDFKKDFNTAITIPASTDERLDTVSPWDSEIWFRPAKLIISREGTDQMAANLRDPQQRRSMQTVLIETQMQQILGNGITGTSLDSLRSDSNLIILASSILAIEMMPAIIRFSGRIFPSKFYLDTAMIPEIIYHEYSHFALSDHLALESTSVIEGLANYFAGQISGKFHWGNGPGRYSRDVGRNATGRELYAFRAESKLFVTSNFVFKLLWGIKKIYGEKKANKLIYTCREKLDKNSDIKHDLVNALFENLKLINEDNLLSKMKLHNHLQNIGL